MAVHTFTKPYVVSAKVARQLENAPKSRRKSCYPKASVTTISDFARKYGTKK